MKPGGAPLLWRRNERGKVAEITSVDAAMRFNTSYVELLTVLLWVSLCAPRDVQLSHRTARAFHLSCSARCDVARDVRHTLLCAERVLRHYARHSVNFLRRVSCLQTRTTRDAQMRKLRRYPPLSNAQTLTLLTSASCDLPR
jgi:hypothetical protein